MPYNKLEKWYLHLTDNNDNYNIERMRDAAPHHTIKTVESNSITSVVQFLRNRELGIRRPHVKTLHYFLRARNYYVKKARMCNEYCLFSKLSGHSRAMCYEHRLHRGLNYVHCRNKGYGEDNRNGWPYEILTDSTPDTSSDSSSETSDAETTPPAPVPEQSWDW